MGWRRDTRERQPQYTKHIKLIQEIYYKMTAEWGQVKEGRDNFNTETLSLFTYQNKKEQNKKKYIYSS